MATRKLSKNNLFPTFPFPYNAILLGGSLHKNNTNHLLLGLYHAPVNWISIVFMQIPPKCCSPPPPKKKNCLVGFVKVANISSLLAYISENKLDELIFIVE